MDIPNKILSYKESMEYLHSVIALQKYVSDKERDISNKIREELFINIHHNETLEGILLNNGYLKFHSECERALLYVSIKLSDLHTKYFTKS